MLYKIFPLPKINPPNPAEIYATELLTACLSSGYQVPINVNIHLFADMATRMCEACCTGNEVFSPLDHTFDETYGKMDDMSCVFGVFDPSSEVPGVYAEQNFSKFDLVPDQDNFAMEASLQFDSKLRDLWLIAEDPDLDDIEDRPSEERTLIERLFHAHKHGQDLNAAREIYENEIYAQVAQEEDAERIIPRFERITDRFRSVLERFDSAARIFYARYYSRTPSERESYRKLIAGPLVTEALDATQTDEELFRIEQNRDLINYFINATKSQDAVGHHQNKFGDLVVVCDGLGGTGPDSRLIANAIRDAMVESAKSQESPITDKESFFKFIQSALFKASQALATEDPDISSTVLVVILDRTSNRAWVFQKGDGAAKFVPDASCTEDDSGAPCVAEFSTTATYAHDEFSALRWQEPTDCFSVEDLHLLAKAETDLENSTDFERRLQECRPFKGQCFQSYPFAYTKAKGQLLAASDGIWDNKVTQILDTDVQIACKIALCHLNAIHALLDPCVDPQSGPVAELRTLTIQQKRLAQLSPPPVSISPDESNPAAALRKRNAVRARSDSMDMKIHQKRAQIGEIKEGLDKDLYTHLKTLNNCMKDPTTEKKKVMLTITKITWFIEAVVLKQEKNQADNITASLRQTIEQLKKITKTLEGA